MRKRYSRSSMTLGLILLITPILIALSGCDGDNAEVTSDFTARMRISNEERTKVLARASTLREDCEQGLARDPYCYNGETWYTDQVMSKFNGWITALQDDLVARKSLSNVSSYDGDFEPAFQNAESFIAWVDDVHRSFKGETSQGGGALGAPRVLDALPPIVEAATTVWHEYQEGKQAQVDKLKDSMEEQKFPTYSSIS